MTLAHKAPAPQPSEELYRTGYELVAAKIAELIISSNLKPGDRLPTERALGEQLGVSRTVIREAIKMLSATGIVRAQQGSGLYVSSEPRPFTVAAIDMPMSVEPSDVLNLFEFRMTIELQTVRLAAERITPKEVRALQEAVTLNRQSAETNRPDQFHESDTMFHIGIARATRNPFFISALGAVHRLQNWVTIIATGGAPGSYLVAAEQHEKILAAIQEGQSEMASQAMQMHIQTVLDSYQQEVRRRLRGDAVKN